MLPILGVQPLDARSSSSSRVGRTSCYLRSIGNLWGRNVTLFSRTSGGRPMDATSEPDQVALAVDAFSKGKPVMVFDSSFRESETDLLWPAQYASPDVIRKLRQDCGGLLFLAIGEEIGNMFDLPWLQDIQSQGRSNMFPISSPIARKSNPCLLYTSPSPRDRQKSRMPSSA